MSDKTQVKLTSTTGPPTAASPLEDAHPVYSESLAIQSSQVRLSAAERDYVAYTTRGIRRA